MANNYYKNAKTTRLELPLGVSGTIKINPGQYVKGDSFAPMAELGFLTDEGTGTPAEVTADPTLLAYTESSEVETATISAGDGVNITAGGEISTDVVDIHAGDGIAVTKLNGVYTVKADVVEVTAGDGITVTPTSGTFEVAADVVDIAQGTGITVTPVAGTYTIALATPPTVSAKLTDGAIAAANNITYFITKGSALGSSTLATPTVTTHDGYTMTFVSTTGYAHVISVASGKVNGGTNTTLTFDTNVGSHVTLVAYQGVWYTTSSAGVTIS